MRSLMRFCLAALIVGLAYAAGNATDRSDNMRPRWITSGLPEPKSPGYIFISAQGAGKSLDEARQSALMNLVNKLEHERGLEITSTLEVSKNTTKTLAGASSTSSKTFDLVCREKGKEVNLVTRVIDEYWEYAGKQYTVTELFTVNNANYSGISGSYADDIRLSTHYGAKPVVMSVIPGVGQIYKGSSLKGGLILGSTAVCAAGIIASENLRHSYVNKSIEYPKHYDFYHKRATDWGNTRNVIIGVTAALYVYNLIDAAIAPGRRRVIVKSNRRVNYSVAPTIGFDVITSHPEAGLIFTLTL